jgi:hypothetical protein
MRIFTSFFLLLFLYFFLFNQSCYSQKYVSDSAVINFGTDTTLIIPMNIDSVVDMRDNLQGSQIKITEVIRFVFIPVDYFYVTKTELNNEIHNLFKSGESSEKTYKLVIRKFEIASSEGFRKLPVLLCQIEIYSGIQAGMKQYVGTLTYEKEGTKPPKNMDKVFYELLIESWKKDFARDIERVSSSDIKTREVAFGNYVPAPLKAKEFIFSQVSFLAGVNCFQIDADLGFYNPESNTRFNRHTWFFRYRNEKRFESVAFGSRSYHWYKRLNDNWMIDLDQKLCVGVNRWKDLNTYNHKLFDIVNLNARIKAGIYYMPFGKRSFFADVTTSQDLLYIYCMDAFFRSTLGFSVGINF